MYSQFLTQFSMIQMLVHILNSYYPSKTRNIPNNDSFKSASNYAKQNSKSPPTTESISITSNTTFNSLDIYVGVGNVASFVTPYKDFVLYPSRPLSFVLRFYYAIQSLLEDVERWEVEMNDFPDFEVRTRENWGRGRGN